jgi:hypothetical protein
LDPGTGIETVFVTEWESPPASRAVNVTSKTLGRDTETRYLMIWPVLAGRPTVLLQANVRLLNPPSSVDGAASSVQELGETVLWQEIV